MLVRPGTFQDNTPAEFLLGVPNIRLELLFLLPDEPLPDTLPDHDLLLNGIGYSSASRPLLERMIPWLATLATSCSQPPRACAENLA